MRGFSLVREGTIETESRLDTLWDQDDDDAFYLFIPKQACKHQANKRRKKKNHSTIRDIIPASSHVLSSISSGKYPAGM